MIHLPLSVYPVKTHLNIKKKEKKKKKTLAQLNIKNVSLYSPFLFSAVTAANRRCLEVMNYSKTNGNQHK